MGLAFLDVFQKQVVSSTMPWYIPIFYHSFNFAL